MAEEMKVLVSAEEIDARVREVAADIRAAYEGQEITIVGMLEDSFVFLADLIRAIDAPLSCCFIKASKHQSGGHTDIIYTTEFDPQGTNILIVAGVLDTGVTMDYLERQLLARGAKSVKACVLVNKPDFRTIEVEPEFSAFKLEEEHIFGYGLGIGNSYRYFPYLAVFTQDS